MSIMNISMKILLLTLCLITPSFQIYCSSTCIDYVDTCFDDTPQGCYVCANHIYNQNANMSSTTPCGLLAQTSIIANDLPNTNMALTGYSSSKTTTITCTNYTFSGQYTNQDYISKNFTNIPLNHYSIIVRFNVGYIGTWTLNDSLRLTLQDSAQSQFYDYRYYCVDNVENICGQVGPTSDCIRIREYTITHNTSYLFLNFSALTTEADPNIQFWGIKQLYVVAKMCNSYCLTCYGPSNTQCLTCASGYFLQGNVCLPSCSMSFYALGSERLCLTSCPAYYYGYTSLTDNTKSCLSCVPGCMLCSDASTCQAWSNQQAYVPNFWKDKQQFWILLIIISVGLLALVIFKLIKKNLPPSEIEEHMVVKSDEQKKNKSQINQNPSGLQESKGEIIPLPNDSIADSLGPTVDLKGNDLWFNELVEIQPVQFRVKGRRRQPKPLSPQDHMQEVSNKNVDTTQNLDV